MLNQLYCPFPIEQDKLVTAGIYTDNNLTTIPVDVINCLKALFIAHSNTIYDGDGTNAENVLS